MINKIIRPKKKVLWRWVSSYLIIMIIPLLFGVIIYMYALYVVKKDVQTIQQQAISQVHYNIESMLENLYKISYTLSSSAYSSGIYVLRNESSSYQPLSMAQVQKTMGSYSIANNNISGIYMYFPENDYLLTNSLTYKYEKISDQTKRFLGISDQEFTMLSENESNGELVVMQPDSGSPSLYYVYRSPQFNEKITVFMPLNMDVLREMARIEDTGVCLIIGGRELWLSDSKENLPEALSQESRQNRSMDAFLTDTAYWMGMAIDDGDVYLATYIYKDAYLAEISVMSRILFCYLILSLILGGIFAGVFSKNHYRPVKALMQGVEKSYTPGANEYQIITDYYTSVKADYQTSRKELRESQNKVRNNRLSKLLNSSYEKFPEDVLRKIKGAQTLEEGAYILLGILIVHEENRQQIKESADDQLDRFIVENILTEVLSGKFSVIDGETDGFLVFILRLLEDTDPMDILIQSLEYAVYYIDQFYHIRLTINISRTSRDIRRIGSSFDEIKMLQEYRDWSSKDDVCIRTASGFYFPDENEQESIDHYHKYREMLKYMKSGQYDKVDEMLQSLISKKENSGGVAKGGMRKERMVAEIVEYIDKHYDDWQLSGKMFAEKYQVSLSYLSQIFKKEKGIGLLDYMNKIRYTKAKAMIDAGATIQEAASKAGYTTTQPLRRLFRQFEGMTPSESRKKKS